MSGPYLSLLLATTNQDVTGQHTRLSHFLKNLAAYCQRYNLSDQVELVVVDYNSSPYLPPLWNTSSIKVPSAAEGLPLVRVITVTKAMHKVGSSVAACYHCLLLLGVVLLGGDPGIASLWGWLGRAWLCPSGNLPVSDSLQLYN
jgi:hypothetical protein